MRQKRDIIIDTDPGVDDAIALMLAIRSDFFNIQAITTVAGNTSIENTTRNARFILDLLQRSDIPVYSGASKPLAGELHTAEFVHGTYGLGHLQPSNAPDLTGDAVARMIEIIKQHPRPITVVTLGPLTNLAMALQQQPDIVENIEEVVIMGGAIEEAGNMTRAAEFNVFVDPEAADVVLRTKVNKTLVPLDACNHVELPLSDFEAIEDPKIREAALKMIEDYIAKTLELESDGGAKAYDPLTIYYLINPAACSIKMHDVLVETKGEHTRGMTVADRRRVADQDNVLRVVMHIDESAFKHDLMNYLNQK